MKNIKREKFKFYILPILVLLFVPIISFLIMFPNFEKKNEKNVKFIFSNISSSFKNDPCQIKLNDSIYINAVDLSKAKDTLIELKDGFYNIEISTTNGDFKIKESFKIKDSEKKYIYINFSYLPYYNDYLPFYKKGLFERYIRNGKYTQKEKSELWKQINQKITVESLKSSGYRPKQAAFEIKILDYQYVKI